MSTGEIWPASPHKYGDSIILEHLGSHFTMILDQQGIMYCYNPDNPDMRAVALGMKPRYVLDEEIQKELEQFKLDDERIRRDSEIASLMLSVEGNATSDGSTAPITCASASRTGVLRCWPKMASLTR